MPDQTLAQLVRAKYPDAYGQLSDQQLESAVRAKYPGVYDAVTSTAAQPAAETDDRGNPVFRASSKPVLESVGDFAGEATAGMNPKNIYHALKSIVMDLPGTVQHIGEAQGSLYQKAEASYKAGDYIAAARHLTNYLLPILGPRLDQSGDYMQQGEYAKGLGVVADIGLQAALPAAAGRISTTARAVLPSSRNAIEASAIRAGEAESVPVDAATKTGSGFAKDVQKRLSGTLGGASPIERMQAAQAEGLTRWGTKLTAESNARTPGVPGTPTSPVAAGEGVRQALSAAASRFSATADAAYGRLRGYEAAQAHSITRSGGVQSPATAAQPFTTVPLAVDISPTKAAMLPTYEALKREAALVPLMGDKARALTTLDRLMQAPDLAPLSTADAVAGDLKSIARVDDAFRRTQGQGIAADTVTNLERSIRSTAQNAGQDVYNALLDGRAATKSKHAVIEALDLFGDEPRQVYNQLTATKDLGLTKLRALRQHAPEQLPTVGRAYLEEAMDHATEAGRFDHADALYANWQKLGTETKQLLFAKPGQVQALDDFFLLAKRLTANRNPSGTANVANALNATQVLAYFPAKWTAQLLTTPKGVKALTTAVRISVNASPAIRRAAIAQVVRIAQGEGLPLPAAADDRTTPEEAR